MKRAFTVLAAVLGGSVGVFAGNVTPASAAPAGAGFTVDASDLAFILKQIKIAEQHVLTATPTNPCGTLVGPGANQVPGPLVSYGLRTVDGSCNNLQPGRELFGAADQVFPRLTNPVRSAAEDSNVPGIGPVGPPGITSYTQKSGVVVDSQPRLISNLIVDQTASNPAAVTVAENPVRSQGLDPVVACDSPGVPAGCTPAGQTLFIPNITTDVGLSPPFNGMFTLFGQFFDHGLDFVNKGGSGSVFIPLQPSDPLIAGFDGILGDDPLTTTVNESADDIPVNQRFMVLTRATNLPGPDGILGNGDNITEGVNSDSPWVDLSQAYASHSSHQVFLRQYVNNAADRPVATGKFISGLTGSLPNWTDIKAQAATLLGLQLVDRDVHNIPMIAADAYGKFTPGPDRGLPQYVLLDGTLLEGNTTNPVAAPANVRRINTAFLNDIAHNATPSTPTTPPLSVKTPDADLIVNGPTGVVAPNEYDDEMLNLHFIAGDGRANENIGLTAIHQVFEAEHNRLVADIQNTILTDTSGLLNIADWQTASGAAGWNGERLFQAARFVTEMEYQHLVFEDFARKLQPGISPFQVYHDDVNPAIPAEFAHAVYRFGHSMLTDTIDRKDSITGVHNDIPLFDGFLNPVSYYQGPGNVTLSGPHAAGNIIMGMSDQVGNEIDEFVTATLRDRLVGLPLDLAALNMSRARSEGVPPLNEVRRQLNATTSDSSLAPYTDWVDFGLGLKHPESLVNFVAAYGKHPNIIAATTIPAKRAAAGLIVSYDASVPDAADFMNGTGVWSNTPQGVTITGLDTVDLWMGGLAEKTNLFGGHLGNTFAYIFERTMLNLQNGDRFYYLARTPGLNLRAQLEHNTFSEIMMRNTTAHTLKQDAFGTSDCKFQIANLVSPAPVGSAITGVGSVADDPASDCDENALLQRMGTGQWRYRTTNSVDPAGINGQSVFNGTPGVDRVQGGVDNDTILGNEGNDILEGNDGADIALGGIGDDIITDSAGDDVPKGGPGNDAIDAGPGLDIVMGGDGHDFTNGGLNDNETFAGPGNDYVVAGGGADMVFGGSGDDWIQGGDGQELLCGESCAPFFDDPDAPGHDVFVGQNGEEDYDSEGGDDLLSAGPGVERNSGAAGYDWVFHQYDPLPADADLSLGLIGLPLPANVLRDRNAEVEALSGWNGNDILRGDSIAPTTVGGDGFTGCDALDQNGLNRIAGLDAIVPPLNTPLADVLAVSLAHQCTLSGTNVWGDGNIILGGSGSDLLEGRGNNDILDGDKALRVRISVRAAVGSSVEIGSASLMESTYLAGSTRTLQQDVFAGIVNPGQLVIVRELVSTPSPTDVDTAVYTGVFADYDITQALEQPGNVTVTTVTHARNIGLIDNGVDTLRGIERLQFGTGAPITLSDLPTNSAAQGTIEISDPTPAENNVLTETHTITDLDGVGTLTTNWQAEVTPGNWVTQATGATFTPNDAVVGMRLRVLITFTDNAGAQESVASDPTAIVTNVNDAPVGGVVGLSAATRPQEAAPLTATHNITDPDGTTLSVFAFQWQRGQVQNATGTLVDGAANWANIAGATTLSFTPTQTEINRNLRLVVTYVDDQGTAETVASASTFVTGDVFTGGTAGDTWTGTAGDDIARGNAGDDTLNAGNGNDIFLFSGTGDGFDAVTGGGGTDVVRALASGTQIGLRSITTVESVTANGFTGVFIQGSAAANTLNFAAPIVLTGITYIDGGAGVDSITGDAGDNDIRGGADIDTINISDGNDTITGGPGNDTLNGGNGNDIFNVGVGDGTDTFNGNAGTDTIRATAANAVISTINFGTANSIEAITSNTFANVTVQGSTGANTLTFSATALTGIVNVDGLAGNDAITGTGLADVIIGGAGVDNLQGGVGNDTMTGGSGNDTLGSGTGNDVLMFPANTDGLGFGADQATQFGATAGAAQDRINLVGQGVTAANFTARVTIVATTTPSTGVLVTVTANAANPTNTGGTIFLPGLTVAAVSLAGGDFIVG